MSELIRKSHNVSVLMYHIVCPAKYRRVVFTPEVDRVEFWSDGYFISTVGQHASEDQIRRYVQKQGQEENYEKIHSQQLLLF